MPTPPSGRTKARRAPGRRLAARALLAALAAGLGGCAELANNPALVDILAGRGTAGALDERTIAAGLREALKVGTERTVSATSRDGGFLDNSLIRIALPEELDTMARGLRAVGFGRQVDALETSMNHAAERASGEAKQVFWNAISTMTLSDATGILRGGDTAATEYFRGRTEGELRRRFQPIVEEKLGQVGLYRIYDSLVAQYNALPLVTAPRVDLDTFVTDRTLDGLFLVLSEEEQRIREDPVARSTDLLRRVFGTAT